MSGAGNGAPNDPDFCPGDMVRGELSHEPYLVLATLRHAGKDWLVCSPDPRMAGTRPWVALADDMRHVEPRG